MPKQSTVSRLKSDPSQTYSLRKRFEREVILRFKQFKSKLVALIQKEDAFGLVTNFNPDQPRDNRGRWSAGGGSSFSSVNLALDELEKHQSSSPNEMRIVIDGDTGEVLVKVEGLPDQVNIPGESIGKMLDKNIIDMHSHPDKSSMSDGDWGMFAWSHVKEMSVVSTEEIFSIRKTEEWENIHHTKRNPRAIKERWNAIVDEITMSGTDWTAESAILDTNIRLAKEFGVDFKVFPRFPTINTRWKFRSDPKKVEEFRKWVQEQIEKDLLIVTDSSDPNKWWDAYLEEAYKKGQLSSFESRNKQKLGESMDFYEGTKEQFLRDSFAKPETKEKVQLLASRVYTDLKGVTEAMASVMSRTLVDGLSQGQNPYTIARQMTKDVEGIGVNRARMIARTEVIRAHAEGQLDALETIGVEEVGVAVEWDITGDGRVCPLCSAMDGVVLKVKEAHGLIPRHPNCRCAFLPANVGEDTKGQIRSRSGIAKAFKRSIAREIPKGSKRTYAEQKAKTSWGGADTRIAKKRPKSILD